MNVVFFCIISPLSYLIFFFLPLNCMFNDYNEYIERCTYQLYILIFLLAHFLMKREREKGNYYNWKIVIKLIFIVINRWIIRY